MNGVKKNGTSVVQEEVQNKNICCCHLVGSLGG